MNCEQARILLPEHVYQSLPTAQQDDLQKHLAACPACTQVWRGLQGVRQLLDAPPAPKVQVDLATLYHDARARDCRQFQRWRRLAWAMSAAAAILLVMLGLRFELRWHDRQLVIGWGTAPAPVEVEKPAAVSAAEFQFVQELLHALAADVARRDEERTEALTDLYRRMDKLTAASNRRWQDTQNDVRALYTACFGVREKGATP